MPNLRRESIKKVENMKIDLHVHSAEISPCGHLKLEEIVELYLNAGYDAIVLTNHFNSIVEEWHRQYRNITDFAAAYIETMHRAVEIGESKGLLVLNGCELRFDCNANDYLVFGMTEEHIREHHRFFTMTPDQFGEWARDNGVLFYQAHPFRNGMTVTDPAALFGIEVKNSHPRHNSRNDIALAWAKMHDLNQIGGSDCHQRDDVGTGGIITDYNLRTGEDLLYVLKNNLYTII